MREATAGALTAIRPKLIVADDSANLRALVRTAVGASYAEILEAGDGRELMWSLMRAWWTQPARRDLVVLADVRMPIYTGLDVLEALQDLRWRLPAIITTAFPDDLVRARVEKLGGRMLVKPFTLAELRSTLDPASVWR